MTTSTAHPASGGSGQRGALRAGGGIADEQSGPPAVLRLEQLEGLHGVGRRS